MSSITTSLIVFACIFGGAMFGALLRKVLPTDHLSEQSNNFVKQGMGLISTMVALLLGMLIASAKNAYDTRATEVTQLAAKVMFFDRLLARYGPEAQSARDLLPKLVGRSIDELWPTEAGAAAALPMSGSRDVLFSKIHELEPKTELQRVLQSQMSSTATDIAQTRLLMFEQGGSSVSKPLLIAVVSWLSLIFIGYGLFAPANAIARTTLFLVSLAIASAVFLMLEMDQPFDGIIQISSEPLRAAVRELGK